MNHKWKVFPKWKTLILSELFCAGWKLIMRKHTTFEKYKIMGTSCQCQRWLVNKQIINFAGRISIQSNSNQVDLTANWHAAHIQSEEGGAAPEVVVLPAVPAEVTISHGEKGMGRTVEGSGVPGAMRRRLGAECVEDDDDTDADDATSARARPYPGHVVSFEALWRLPLSVSTASWRRHPGWCDGPAVLFAKLKSGRRRGCG
jgi:hypothetical protein